MNALVTAVSQALRASRAPLSAGALLLGAVWIQLADHVSGYWQGHLFEEQLVDVLTSLQGFGVATLLLVVVGVAGSVSTRASKLLLEPAMRWLVARWQERCAVRKHMRSSRWSPFDVGGSEWAIADAQVTHDRRFITNTIRWLRDWVPGKDAYVAHHAANFWLEPRWGKKVVVWAAHEVYGQVDQDRSQESFDTMRSRLAQDNELRQLMISLERELERNPSAPFVGEESSNVLERLTSAISENEYRLAVMPALAAVLTSIALAWWSWVILLIPVTLLVYGSSLARRDDMPRSALGWLLDGRGSSYALDEVRLWTRREAMRINGSED